MEPMIFVLLALFVRKLVIENDPRLVHHGGDADTLFSGEIRYLGCQSLHGFLDRDLGDSGTN